MPKIGYLTASNFSQIMVAADIKKGDLFLGKGCETLADQIVLKMIGVEEDLGYISADMQRGIDYESIAISRYEQENLITVHGKQQFTWDEKQPYLGCHPDGKVGSVGVIEVKCPASKNHKKNLVNGSQYYSDYLDQCEGVAMLCGAQWIDFISFDDRFPEPMQLAVFRFEADKVWQETFRARADAFWNNLVLPDYETIVNKYNLNK